jgi:hypothetical protein
MTAQLTLESRSDVVRGLVAEFSQGLGYPVSATTGPAIRIEVPESTDLLLELMSHIALCAAKANIEVEEPLCRLQFQHTNAATVVTLGLRIAEFGYHAAPPAVA